MTTEARGRWGSLREIRTELLAAAKTDDDKSYDAFISYRWREHSELAAAIQSGLERDGQAVVPAPCPLRIP